MTPETRRSALPASCPACRALVQQGEPVMLSYLLVGETLTCLTHADYLPRKSRAATTPPHTSSPL